jgi:ligand-binding sensor domain-containing protein
VFASEDAGLSFHPSNEGFSQRQITSVVVDVEHPADVYASVVNDKEFGGVFRSRDGEWTQISAGLGGRDVFDLGQSPRGRLVAATNRGLYVFEAESQRWELSKNIVNSRTAPQRKPVPGRKGRVVAPAQGAATIRSSFEERASAVALGNRRWYAATDAGVLTSDNEGKSWSGGAIDGEKAFLSVSARDQTVVAATAREVWMSHDEAAHWTREAVPAWVTRIYSVTVAEDGAVWIATREGALRWLSYAQGDGVWEHVLDGLPAREIRSIRAEGGRMLAAVDGAKTIYVSRDQGKSWKAEPAAMLEITGAAMQGKRIYVTSRHNGLLAEESHEEKANGLQ